MIARRPCGTWIKALTVASFRTWRVSRPSIAQDPAINSNRNQHAPYLSKMAERGIVRLRRTRYGRYLQYRASRLRLNAHSGVRLRRTRYGRYLQYRASRLRLNAHSGRTLRFPASQPTASYEKWRRERDSNPRYTINVHTISSRAPSATRASLRQSTSWCMQQVQSHLSPSAQRTLRSNPPIPNFPANCIL